jgi:hypothetical protein
VPLREIIEAELPEKERTDRLPTYLDLVWQAGYYGLAPPSVARQSSSQPASSRAALYAQRIQEMVRSSLSGVQRIC